MSPRPVLPTMYLDEISARVADDGATDWLWHGYIARGNLTLLTSLWKTGKTTLVCGLLHQLGTGGQFLGLACSPAHVLIVSEEAPIHWVPRARLIPLGRHVRLMARPFLRRPTVDDWELLTEQAAQMRSAGELDLVVVDTLASFLPGRSESDPSTLLDMLQPLQRLASTGVAVLILHHPRRRRSEEGQTARGSGALLGFVDVILELHVFGQLASDQRKRKLIGVSRYSATQRQLVYQWDPETGVFERIDNFAERRFQENWSIVAAILGQRTTAATHHELLADWPADVPPPPASVLYEWLNRATEMKLVRRHGQGRKLDPYRYRLPNADDEYYDRGELPPLRGLERLLGRLR